MANESSSYRGVILDIDGTLVDSNEAHVQAWTRAFSEHGFNVPAEEVRRLVGMGGDNLVPAAVGLENEDPRSKSLRERHGELFKEKLPGLRPFPRVRELLQRMKEDGMELVVATSSNPDQMKALLEIADVGDLLEDAASKGDAKSSKPDPDIVQAALERIGLAAGEVVMLGDTPYDVEAAGRIGIRTLALRCGGFTDEDLAGALAIYDNAADLLARYESSPLATASAVMAGRR
ncbi:MAG TPA: HAD family hydrolase [Thermoanaerobaculia bacterium]|nr:HAD family hydrolase [Thermoanaerobaculia bacterium]